MEGLETAMELKAVVYFDKPGEENTDEAFRIAKERARELGINTVIVASTRGNNAAKAVDFFNGMKVVVVSHVTGRREPNVQELTDENRQKIESKGGVVVTTAHAFMGVEAAMSKKFVNMQLFGGVIAATLRIFGQGMKVVCEIALMAADAGQVRTDEEVIAIAGTTRGADTVVVLTPVNSKDFFDIRVKEILCKPRF
ncbi:pyruvate kinase alpha/beta domain-containing protein [Chloroflexota bacterium]